MKVHTPLIIATLLASMFSGCSTHPRAAVIPKVANFGIIEVADGSSSSHLLADGRTCVLTPTILPGDNQIKLEMSVNSTNAAGTLHVHSLTTFFTPDQATLFEFDSNIITLTLHIK